MEQVGFTHRAQHLALDHRIHRATRFVDALVDGRHTQFQAQPVVQELLDARLATARMRKARAQLGATSVGPARYRSPISTVQSASPAARPGRARVQWPQRQRVSR
jgi:hypothetical protein